MSVLLTRHKFNLTEVAGSMGDLGTLLPLMVGLITINGLNATAVLATIGLFYISIGLYYHVPLPVQPFKVIAAVAIAQGLSPETISAGALEMAVILLLLAGTNIITTISKLFTIPVIRGIQLGLGLTLIIKGTSLVFGHEMFLSKMSSPISFHGFNPNIMIGAAALTIALILINNKKLPAAIVLVFGGMIAGLAMGALDTASIKFGFDFPRVALPSIGNFGAAFIVLTLPQLPLTIGNAVIGTCETSYKLMGKEESARVTPRALCVSMGLFNILFGLVGAMPCCHGAGGMAAHYRFGARTGGSNIIIGTAFIALALLAGKSALAILILIPNPVLGVLLAFAGIELSLMIRDILSQRVPLFIAISIAAIALTTKNMGIAFAAGIILDRVLSFGKTSLHNKTHQ